MQHSELDVGELKSRIVNRAMQLGAAAVRVAPALELYETRRAMSEAFSRGDFETWAFDDRYAARATSPRELLADARSVVCIALPYATPPPQSLPMHGTVSNYAWSADYHRRIKVLLQVVASDIDAAAGSTVTAIACDTRPVAERAYAARSGLGWIGKHTNLIVPGAGPFVFLGEIITSLELPPDDPLRKTCGACARCVDACPTGALRGDYTIDAVRCISDLTQRTDEIPRPLRPLVGMWVWGCDICQSVCPPAKRAIVRGDHASAPAHADAARPNLVALLRVRSGEFKRRYAGTAMGWRGAAVLRRNAAVALGNALDRAAVPALAAALSEDPHPMVRGHVAWSLGRIGSPAALQALRSACECERHPAVCEEITNALEPFCSAAR